MANRQCGSNLCATATNSHFSRSRHWRPLRGPSSAQAMRIRRATSAGDRENNIFGRNESALFLRDQKTASRLGRPHLLPDARKRRARPASRRERSGVEQRVRNKDRVINAATARRDGGPEEGGHRASETACRTRRGSGVKRWRRDWLVQHRQIGGGMSNRLGRRGLQRVRMCRPPLQSSRCDGRQTAVSVGSDGADSGKTLHAGHRRSHDSGLRRVTPRRVISDGRLIRDARQQPRLDDLSLDAAHERRWLRCIVLHARRVRTQRRFTP